MIKAVIFDLSDVCFNSEEPPFLRRFARRHRLPFAEFEKQYLALLYQAENHTLRGKEVWRRLLARYRLKLKVNDIIKEMIDGKRAKKGTIALAAKLRARGYKTAFFTNYCEDYWKPIAERFDLSEYFDTGLVSYQIGARKPAAKGFAFLLKKLGIAPDEAIFIDDREGNLAEPAKLGIHTVHFTDVPALRKELISLGVATATFTHA